MLTAGGNRPCLEHDDKRPPREKKSRVPTRQGGDAFRNRSPSRLAERRVPVFVPRQERVLHSSARYVSPKHVPWLLYYNMDISALHADRDFYLPTLMPSLVNMFYFSLIRLSFSSAFTTRSFSRNGTPGRRVCHASFRSRAPSSSSPSRSWLRSVQPARGRPAPERNRLDFFPRIPFFKSL